MEEAKTILFKTLSLFILVAIVLGVYSMFWGLGRNWAASLYPSRIMSVSATGEITVVPDIATLSFSVVSEGSDTTAIANDNNETVNTAIEFLKEKGIEEKDITTSQYNLSPIYSQAPRSGTEIFVPSIVRYSLTQTVSVKIRDFSLISDVIGSLPEIGINRINGLSFSIDDKDAALAEAREEAFAKAHEKAEDMAKQNGVKLGRVVNISEYSNSPYYYGREVYGMGGADDMAFVAPKIEPGTQDVSLEVSISYEIR